MDDILKIKYFDEIIDVFSSHKEGWYIFYADYASSKVYWAPSFVEYLGLPSSVMDEPEALSLYTSLIHPEDYPVFMENVQKMFAGETDELTIPYRIKTKSGEYVTVGTYSKFKRDENGNPSFYAGAVVDYQKQDFIDPITGLYTVKSMIENMDLYSQQEKPYYLAILNVRNFSSVNNKYGYIGGNSVLRSLSQIIMACRDEANVYKLDGAKYAILKSFEPGDYSIESFGSKVFENVKALISKGIKVEGTKLYLDINGGAVYTKELGISSNTMITSALFALSKAAKCADSNSLYLFNESWLNEERQKLALYEAIRYSIKDNCRGFFMVYQPIFSKETGKMIAMEALLRWSSEEYGIISPNSFIEWLEKDPVFQELGVWILKQSLEDAKQIIHMIPDFIVNINLAYPQLESDNFESTLIKIVKESKVNPKNIGLELTERCKLLDEKLLISRMRFIQSLGIHTSLDDFGTGYSAINLLFNLPADQIKIDRFFINNIQTEKPRRIMLKAIIDCSREIGARVCVEGIENKEMADYICSNYNITGLQGFYYSKPITIENFLTKMRDWI
ncbi:MAG: EAL domain-containing protein [Eubacterium sp.]|nr:EAL domain-containing protein [Eubacterium sp.]